MNQTKDTDSQVFKARGERFLQIMQSLAGRSSYSFYFDFEGDTDIVSCSYKFQRERNIETEFLSITTITHSTNDFAFAAFHASFVNGINMISNVKGNRVERLIDKAIEAALFRNNISNDILHAYYSVREEIEKKGFKLTQITDFRKIVCDQLSCVDALEISKFKIKHRLSYNDITSFDLFDDEESEIFTFFEISNDEIKAEVYISFLAKGLIVDDDDEEESEWICGRMELKKDTFKRTNKEECENDV